MDVTQYHIFADYCNKLIPKIEMTNGEVITDQFEILEHAEKCYNK